MDKHDDIIAHLKSDILQEHRKLLTDNLDPERHMDFLRSKYILSEDDCEEIKALPTRQRRASRFLDILCKKGPEAYDMLCRSLEYERTQLFILRVLNQEYERRFRNYNEMFRTRPSSVPGLDIRPPNIRPPLCPLQPATNQDLRCKQVTCSCVSCNQPGHGCFLSSSVPADTSSGAFSGISLSSVEGNKGSIHTQEVGEGDGADETKESDSEFVSIWKFMNGTCEGTSSSVTTSSSGTSIYPTSSHHSTSLSSEQEISQHNPRMSSRGPSVENMDDGQNGENRIEEILSDKLDVSACEDSRQSGEHDETEVKGYSLVGKERSCSGDMGVPEDSGSIDEPDEDEREFFASLPQSYIENPSAVASTGRTNNYMSAIPEIIPESLPSWKQEDPSEKESGSQRDSGFSSRSSQEVSSCEKGYISPGEGKRNATIFVCETSVSSLGDDIQWTKDKKLNLSEKKEAAAGLSELHSKDRSATESEDYSQC